ncbi:MAG: diphthamide biosynthesis enzyme Dph2 [Candidatus Hadarchaeales archaeon]
MRHLYDLEEGRVREFIAGRHAKRVAVALPAGLRPLLPEIEEHIRSAGAEPTVLADPCYGACDPGDDRARTAGCDALVHYGHSDMGLPTSLPTLYVEARMISDPSESLRGALNRMKFSRVGLISNVQHAWSLERVAGILEQAGIRAIVPPQSSRTRYPGQVLGCDFSCARSIAQQVEGFLYVGTGAFHPLGCSLATGRPTAAFNPVSSTFELYSDQREFLRRRSTMISRAAMGDRFGVIACTKPGQRRFRLAENIAEKLRKSKKEAHVLVLDNVRPEELQDFKLDALVCTACPRIAIDDSERFSFPILTPFEVEVMLGAQNIKPYQLDEIGKRI